MISDRKILIALDTRINTPAGVHCSWLLCRSTHNSLWKEVAYARKKTFRRCSWCPFLEWKYEKSLCFLARNGTQRKQCSINLNRVDERENCDRWSFAFRPLFGRTKEFLPHCNTEQHFHIHEIVQVGTSSLGTIDVVHIIFARLLLHERDSMLLYYCSHTLGGSCRIVRYHRHKDGASQRYHSGKVTSIENKWCEEMLASEGHLFWTLPKLLWSSWRTMLDSRTYSTSFLSLSLSLVVFQLTIKLVKLMLRHELCKKYMRTR